MRMRSIRGSSLWYFVLGAICVLYMLYFGQKTYHHPNWKNYYVYFNIYHLIAIPMLIFSTAGFITLVIRDSFLITLDGFKKRILLFISLVLTLIYLGYVTLMFMLKEMQPIGITNIYNLLFVVDGAIVSLGVYKDRVYPTKIAG